MKGRRQTTWGFQEELKPCGKPGIKHLVPFWHHSQPKPDVSKVLVSQPASHPWFIILWEPITNKIPGPHLVYVWCCYVKTVIFYFRPHIIDPFSRRWFGNGWNIKRGNDRSYLEWFNVETAFRGDDVVEWEGELFKVGGGRIVYKNKTWWCRTWARRHVPLHEQKS